MKTLSLFLALALTILSDSRLALAVSCPSGAPPVVESQVNPKLSVMVCGTEKITNRAKEKVLSDFIVLYAYKGKVSASVYEGRHPQDYRVQPDKEGLRLHELFNNGSGDFPVFESLIRCGKRSCYHAPTSCIFKRRNITNPAPWTQLEPYLNGNRKGMSPAETLIVRVGNLALSGHAPSIDFFLGKTKASLSGPSAERFLILASLIKRLHRGKCL